MNEIHGVHTALCSWYSNLVFSLGADDSSTRALVPHIKGDRIAIQVKALACTLGPTLPEATVRALIKQFERAASNLAGQRVHPSQLPQPSPDPRVPLDADVIATDAYHVHIAGWPELLLSDCWRLPLGLTDGILVSGMASLSELQAQMSELHARDQAGDPTALSALQAQARRYGPLQGRQGGNARVPRGKPHRSGHATLHRQTSVDGSVIWVITWSIRVPPDFLPAVIHRDVVGVDPGVRTPLTWYSETVSGQMRPGSLSGQTGDSMSGDSSMSHVVNAVRRCAWFRRTSSALDQALRALLTHEIIAIEDTNWVNMSADGNLWPREVMHLTGVTDVLPWVESLAVVRRSRVVRVPAWDASHHCGLCGRRGVRTLAGNQFRCGSCQHRSCADVNAAMYHRWWAIHHRL